MQDQVHLSHTTHFFFTIPDVLSSLCGLTRLFHLFALFQSPSSNTLLLLLNLSEAARG